MDDGLKQRLVGAAVLLAVAVLFVPVLFERESRLVVDQTSQIPLAPVIEPVVVEAPEDKPEIPPVKPADSMYELLPEESEEAVAKVEPEKVAAKQGSSKAPAPAVKTPAEAAKATAGQERELLDKRGVPNAWAVQVASFNTPARADAMRDRLLAQEYPAFTRSASTSQGTLTRVFVGPKISRDQAYRLKSKLDAELKTETLVVTFMP